MEVVSRAEERQAVMTLLNDAALRPTGLILEGDAGIGKTTIWLDGARRARDAGFTVLSAQCAQAEVRSTYAAAADLLRVADTEVVRTLAPVQQAALDRILLSGTDGPATDERVVSTTVLSVIESLAQRSPVLIAIDDIQWLDVASRSVIGFAARRLEGRIGVLATARTGEAGTADLTSWLRLTYPDALRRVVVGPLSVGPLGEVIALRLGRRLSRPTLTHIHHISDGNPFFAVELARSVTVDAPVGVALPDSLSTVVDDRIGQIDSEASELLIAVSACQPATIDLLGRTLGTPFEQVSTLVAALEIRGVLERRGSTIRFTHPLLAHGVYAKVDPPRRRVMHRRLADAVEDPELRARHLALSATTEDAATVDALDAAADIAASRGAPAAAAELLELALAVGGDTVARRIRAAELYFRSGSTPAAQRILPTDVGAVPAGPLRCLTLMLTAAIRAYHDDLASAVEAMSLALEQAGDDLGLRALCCMRLALALHMTGRLAEAVERGSEAVTLTAQLGVGGLHSQALAFWVTTSFVYGLGVDHEALRLAMATEDELGQATTWFSASAVEAVVTAWTADLHQARAKLVRVRERMRANGTELDVIWAANHMSMVDVWLGRYDEAAAAATEAVERATQTGGQQLLISAWNVKAEAAARLGREREARESARDAIAAAHHSGAIHLATAPLATLGFLEVSLGDYSAALAVMEPLLARFDPEHDTEIVPGGFLPDAVDALVATGRAVDAKPLVEALQHNGTRHDRPWMLAMGSRGRAQIDSALGNLDAAESALQLALRHHDALGMPFERARTLLVLGQLQRRRRRLADATTSVREALDTFERLGASLWTARAAAEVARLRTSRDTERRLTPAEQRIAELAATGMSNKDIAARQFLSEKTIEAYLSNAYRKLGIRSRGGLHAALTAAE
ncbi:AAA family ATPase [Mycolicibacterium aichiense]|uniref:AAA family ATPase n=1 Tax=Mycolicibacterium aichiense TaxID=1799 RepID=UPI003D67DDBA